MAQEHKYYNPRVCVSLKKETFIETFWQPHVFIWRLEINFSPQLARAQKSHEKFISETGSSPDFLESHYIIMRMCDPLFSERLVVGQQNISFFSR